MEEYRLYIANYGPKDNLFLILENGAKNKKAYTLHKPRKKINKRENESDRYGRTMAIRFSGCGSIEKRQ